MAALELMLIKTGGMLWPYLQIDKDKLRLISNGQPFKVKLIRQSRRSVEHNELYWGGLLTFALDYWEQSFNYVSTTEVLLLEAWTKRIYRLANDIDGTLDKPLIDFIEYANASRRTRAETEETAQQLEAIHRWVKEEAGYFILEFTPTGIRKHLKSINFNAMSQEEFNQFYKAAFNVIWRFVLSRHMTEEEAKHAINSLQSMG